MFRISQKFCICCGIEEHAPDFLVEGLQLLPSGSKSAAPLQGQLMHMNSGTLGVVRCADLGPFIHGYDPFVERGDGSIQVCRGQVTKRKAINKLEDSTQVLARALKSNEVCACPQQSSVVDMVVSLLPLRANREGSW